jgi:hypothetical protein
VAFVDAVYADQQPISDSNSRAGTFQAKFRADKVATLNSAVDRAEAAALHRADDRAKFHRLAFRHRQALPDRVLECAAMILQRVPAAAKHFTWLDEKHLHDVLVEYVSFEYPNDAPPYTIPIEPIATSDDAASSPPPDLPTGLQSALKRVRADLASAAESASEPLPRLQRLQRNERKK